MLDYNNDTRWQYQNCIFSTCTCINLITYNLKFHSCNCNCLQVNPLSVGDCNWLWVNTLSVGDYNWLWVNTVSLADCKLQLAGWDKVICSRLSSDISWDLGELQVKFSQITTDMLD